MYGQIASIRGAVDLSPQESLDQTQSFLTQQGYTIVRRSDYALTAERRPPDAAVEQNKRHLLINKSKQGKRLRRGTTTLEKGDAKLVLTYMPYMRG